MEITVQNVYSNLHQYYVEISSVLFNVYTHTCTYSVYVVGLSFEFKNSLYAIWLVFSFEYLKYRYAIFGTNAKFLWSVLFHNYRSY